MTEKFCLFLFYDYAVSLFCVFLSTIGFSDIKLDEYFIKNKLPKMHEQLLALNKGIEDSQNKNEAILKFSKDGNLAARYIVVKNNIEKDPILAFKMSKWLFEAGWILSWKELSIAYSSGVGTTKNAVAAYRVIRRAAECGVMEAMNQLGLYLEIGIGCTQNRYDAFEAYKIASIMGYVPSYINYARMLDDERSRYCDYKEAFKWKLLAAESGDIDGIYWLSLAYINGQGVKTNNTKAYSYALIASWWDEEDEDAKKLLNLCMRDMSTTDIILGNQFAELENNRIQQLINISKK